MSTPNPVAHLKISLVKSIIRIAACYFLAYCNFQLAAGLLAFAEALGIAEELV